ncbi:urease accessory protein UreD [Frankia sp. Ag45/Mut15]|uniref:Urease accessory protein UreD n=1 Tax=Frankia umida TaxID=573489 RepID=A0ABT0JSN0_9ACTN|nr:urease accessory protein UreD [Frankia umida]MCK9874573.1 urease accessory protein UreD [Frankia umida]
MRAHAAVRVERDVRGALRVAELRSAVPLVLRLTGTTPAGVSPPTATVHLVSAAAGPLAGDELRLDLTVGSGVRLVMRSVAAMVALPGRGATGPSRLVVRAWVDDDGELDFQPEPTVVARGADHVAVTEVSLAPSARLCLREEILLGRFDEPPGAYHGTLRVDITAGPHDRTPLLRQELALAPDLPGLHGPAHLGPARGVGARLVAGPAWAAQAARARPVTVTDGRGEAALLPLAGPGYLVTALAMDAVTLRRLLAISPTPDPPASEPSGSELSGSEPPTPHPDRGQ